MSYTLEFKLKGLPKMANQMLRGHWRVKHAHATLWKRNVRNAIPSCDYPLEPLTSAALTLTRVSSVEPDFDGLVSGFKPIIDGLVEVGVLASDKMSCIGQPKYAWEKCAPKAGHIKVKVEAA